MAIDTLWCQNRSSNSALGWHMYGPCGDNTLHTNRWCCIETLLTSFMDATSRTYARTNARRVLSLLELARYFFHIEKRINIDNNIYRSISIPFKLFIYFWLHVVMYRQIRHQIVLHIELKCCYNDKYCFVFIVVRFTGTSMFPLGRRGFVFCCVYVCATSVYIPVDLH